MCADGEPEEQEKRLCLIGVQACHVGSRATEQLPSAAAAGLWINRDPGRGQRLAVTPRRGQRDLEFTGEVGGRHPTASLQDEQGGNETIGAHSLILALEVLSG